MNPAGLAVVDVVKSFGPVPVLKGVTFDVPAGSITALAGANGAGKSTLVRIMSGDLRQDAGDVLLDGRVTRFTTPRDAHRAGLGVVRQDLELVPGLSVAENLFLGAEEPFRRGPALRKSAMAQESRPLLERVGLEIDPGRPVAEFSIGDRQLIAIARALRGTQKGLLLDEPTSSLSPWEVERLHETLRTISHEGLAVLYISHRLGEVTGLCDRALVLRDGEIAASFDDLAGAEESIARAMIPQLASRSAVQRKSLGSTGDIVLSVEDLRCGRHGPSTFQVRAGEIVGVFGLVGAGRSAVGRTLAGLRPPTGGRVLLNGEPFTPNSPSAAFRSGVAYLSEDRKGESIFPGMSVRKNIVVRAPRGSARRGWLRPAVIAEVSGAAVRDLEIKPADDQRLIETLSGGNQQKAVLARLLAEQLKVLILDEPTHGIDVAAKADLLAVLRQEADQGLAVLLISSELDELVSSVDRLLVMRGGVVVHETTDLGSTDEGQLVATAAGAGASS
jgi:ribose transport system ATP-binding protein